MRRRLCNRSLHYFWRMLCVSLSTLFLWGHMSSAQESPLHTSPRIIVDGSPPESVIAPPLPPAPQACQGLEDGGASATVVTAILTGSQVAPPAATSVIGSALFYVYDVNEGAGPVPHICYQLDPPTLMDAFSSHIRRGAPGTNGPTLFMLDVSTGGGHLTSDDLWLDAGLATMDDAVIALLVGDAYVDVQLSESRFDTIRGQIIPINQGTETASGQEFFGLVDATNLAVYEINISETETLTADDLDPSESQARVGEFTEGIFRLTYTGRDGQVYELLQDRVRIHNFTRDITVDGVRASTVAALFGTPPALPTLGMASLTIRMSSPVEMAISNLLVLAPPGAAEKKLVQDVYQQFLAQMAALSLFPLLDPTQTDAYKRLEALYKKFKDQLTSGPVPDKVEARVNQLIQQLGSKKFQERVDAQKKLIEEYRYPAYKQLQQALKSNDPEIRKRAEQILNEYEKQIQAALLQAMEKADEKAYEQVRKFYDDYMNKQQRSPFPADFGKP